MRNSTRRGTRSGTRRRPVSSPTRASRHGSWSRPPARRNAAPIPRPRLPIPTGIPADILLNRPDVRLAERQYAQATAKIGQAEAARYPSASLTGNITTSGLKLGDLGKSSSISWSFGPTLTVPIFNGGQLRAAVDVARAQRDQSFLAYRASVLGALEAWIVPKTK